MVSERDAARIVGCSIACLKAWRARAVGLPYLKLGRLVRYSIADLQQFLLSSRVPKVNPRREGVEETGQRKEGTV
jgi:hypothetical protein